MDNTNKIKIIFKISIISFSCLSVLLIFLAILFNSQHINPYGKEIKIENFSNYYNNIPQDTIDQIFHGLYNKVSSTNQQQTTGLIREQSTSFEYNSFNNHYTGVFIVDLNEIQQSYKISFSWSEDPDNIHLEGETVTISCPSAEENIFKEFICTIEDNEKNQTIINNNPIIQSLPINVEYYTNNYTEYIKYSITLSPIDNNTDTKKLTLRITDYSGKNYERAIQSISNRGYNYKDYNIEYIDLSN